MSTLIRQPQVFRTFGEMYISTNAVVTAIDTVNIYHPVYGKASEGITDNFLFVAGESVNISAVADAGGGQVKVTTAAAHGYSTDDYVTIVGTTNYNGNYQVDSIGTTTEYYITKAFVATQTGRSIRGDRLVALDDGNYRICVAISVSAVAPNKTFSFSTLYNTTICPKCRIDRYMSASDTGAIALTSAISISSGDWLSFSIANLTDATDITIKELNFNVGF